MKPSEKRYLESLAVAGKETVDLFSSKNQKKREKMVVRAFLRCLGVEFSEAELVIGPNEPIDILFGSVNFQNMDMLGGRKPHAAWREQLKRFQAAKSINDVTDPWLSSKPLSFAELTQNIAESLALKAYEKYGAKACAKLDALVYVNLAGRHLYPSTFEVAPAAAQELSRQGWRSVSMVFIPYSAVIVAKPDCPQVLRDKVGQVHMEWSSLGGWFDP